MRDELGAPVARYMGRDTVLREYVDDEEPGEVAGCDGVMGHDEDALFG